MDEKKELKEKEEEKVIGGVLESKKEDNLDKNKILQSLNLTCVKCGKKITMNEIEFFSDKNIFFACSNCHKRHIVYYVGNKVVEMMTN